MKKFNLFVMSLLATASFTLNSCSSDDTMSATSQQQSVDGFYMTLQVKGSANDTGTRTEQQGDQKKVDGTTEESTITSGTVYIYTENGTTPIFKKTISASDWKTAPSQEAEGTTKPIKVSVNSVNTTDTYYVFFLANNTTIENPLATTSTFTSTNGGSDYAAASKFVMFNQNDKSKVAAHSKVKFTTENKSETNPAEADVIYLDRVVARIDKPSVTAEKITTNPDATEAAKQTKHIDYIENVAYKNYAVSNLSNNSYVNQNWTVTESNWTLGIPDGTTYTKDYATYGGIYEPSGLGNFGNEDKNYLFENTTDDLKKATAMYFCIKANLKADAQTGADFADGTFYRYDNHIYTKLSDIEKDTEVANPFAGKGIDADGALALIKGTDGKLIPEDATQTIEEQKVKILPKFREDFHIEVYREGNMYYRYAITDSYYTRDGYYSVLRNSIYRLTVDAIYDLGKDVPNGEDKDDKKPNYYMSVKVAINPWVLNAQSIQLK